MQLDRSVYYAWEILSFLSSFPNESWTRADIAAVVVLNEESKLLLKNVNPKMLVEEVRKKLEKVKSCVSDLEEVSLVEETVRRLRKAGLVRVARGFRITEAGKRANLLQVIETIGPPLKVADCITGKNDILPFDCPKRHSGNCYSHEVYCQLYKELASLLSKITIASMLEPTSNT